MNKVGDPSQKSVQLFLTHIKKRITLEIINSSKKLSKEDIIEFQKNLTVNLPEYFYDFYNANNGGVVSKNSFYINVEDSYVEVSFFIPIKYKLDKLGDVIIETSYQTLINKNVLIPIYVPFAVDWGGNYFCINTNNDSVVLVLADLGVFAEKNIKFLSNNFYDFINHLEEREQEDI